MAEAAVQGATTHQEQFEVQYLAQGHFNMQLSLAQSWDLNQRPFDLITSQPALPTELQPLNSNTTYVNFLH